MFSGELAWGRVTLIFELWLFFSWLFDNWEVIRVVRELLFLILKVGFRTMLMFLSADSSEEDSFPLILVCNS